MKKFKFSICFLVILLTQLTMTNYALAEPSSRYSSISEVVEKWSDYAEEDNTFKVIAESPLQVFVAPKVIVGDHPDVIDAVLKRAIVYMVYLNFIYTDSDRIQVTAQPLQYSLNPYQETLLNAPRYQVDITRDKALAAAQKIFNVKTFNELIDNSSGVDTWSKKFEAVYCDDANGLRRLVNTLGVN